MDKTVTSFKIMVIQLADYIGEGDRDKIMTLLDWQIGLRETIKTSLQLFWEMQAREVFSEDNVAGLIDLLEKCDLLQAAERVKIYQHSRKQVEQTPQESHASPPAQVKKVFIGFSSKSMGEVMEIKKKLDRKIGDRCWIYTECIMYGENVHEKIAGAMSDASVVLFMVNQHFVDSIECEREVNVATHFQKPTIFVMLEDMGSKGWKKSDGTVSGINIVSQMLYRCNYYANPDAKQKELATNILKHFNVDKE